MKIRNQANCGESRPCTNYSNISYYRVHQYNCGYIQWGQLTKDEQDNLIEISADFDPEIPF